MKPKFFFPFIIILFFLLAIWLHHSSHQITISGEASTEVASSNLTTAIKTQAAPKTQLEKNGENTFNLMTQSDKSDLEKEWEKTSKDQSAQARLEELAQRRGISMEVLTQQMLVEWSNTIGKMFEQMNRPIEFYGKVVDQNNEPIGGADVHLSCIIYPEDYFATNFLTDSQGLFAVRNLNGVALNILVAKEGYQEIQGTNQNQFAYYSSTGFRPDLQSPVVFHLQKKAD